MRLGNWIGIGRRRSEYWPSLDKMDLRLSGIATDGISLIGDIGSGGIIKQFPATGFNNATQDVIRITNNSILLLDATATYEYYLETIILSFDANLRRDFMCSNHNQGGGGWTLSMETAAHGFYLYLKDPTDTSGDINRLSTPCFQLGLNTISVKFNLPTKEITININGVSYSHTHALATVIDVSGHPFSLGTGSKTPNQQVLYFKVLKNNVIINEYFFGQRYGQDGETLNFKYLGSFDSVPFIGYVSSPLTVYQDIKNPYINGYDLYWVEDTLKYQAISPVNSFGASLNPCKWNDNYSNPIKDYLLFKRVLPTDIGYHALNYIEMPDLPIFNTTSRTYWKVLIESDPYYVGGTVGKERWFHRTWLDFDWIDLHIETAYRYLFFVKCHWKKAKGHDYVKTKISDIVLFNEVLSSFNHRKDVYEIEDLGHLYFSLNMRSNTGTRFPQVAQKGLKKVILDGNYLRYSSDGGHTYNAGFDLSTLYPVNNFSFAGIAENGNILIFSKTTFVHYSADNLTTITAASVVNLDDSPYVFHTPVNASYPGNYFALLNSFVETDDCIVIGNYAVSDKGAGPINFYYSLDSGMTWKVFYTYGQNPLYTDDGTSNGGEGGNSVGDAGNSEISARVESVNIGYDGNIYIGTEGNPGSMMKCVYNAITDVWTVIPLLNATSKQWFRMKCNGCYEKNGYIYWAAPSVTDDVVGGITYHSHGIFKALLADINDITKHILISPTNMGSIGFINNEKTGHVLVAMSTQSGSTWVEPREIHISPDGGDTWEVFDNKSTSGLLPLICDKDSDIFVGYRDFVMKILE